MAFLDFFRRSAPTTLADEAMAAVRLHVANRNEGIARMRDREEQLQAHVRRCLDALADLKAERQREEAADAAMVVEAAATEIEEGIGLSLIDCGQAAEAPAKRKRKLPEITSEAA